MNRTTPDDPSLLLPSAAAKALLLAEMAAQDVRPFELAARLGATKQTINRLLDPHHPTKIDSIDEALRALGKRLTLAVADC